VYQFPKNPLFSLPWADSVYLRICISSETLPQLLLPYILNRKSSYGSHLIAAPQDLPIPQNTPQKVVIEFSSPNIASEFHGKHLRSTILGKFISIIHEAMGWQVTKVNYLGDWGKDLALLGVGWERFGSEEAFEREPVPHLLEVFHKVHELFLPEQVESKRARDEAKKKGEDELQVTADIESKGLFAERNAFFKRMEEGDEKAVAQAKRIRDVNIDKYAEFYAQLGITFDEYAGESQASHEVMSDIERTLKEKDICEESGGAWVIDMKKHGGKSGAAILRDRTGSSTYFLRYLAAVVERSRKQDFDKMIFVAADRSGHYARLQKVIELLGMAELAKKLQHVSFNDNSHMMEELGHGYQPHDILDRVEGAMSGVLEADKAKAQLIGEPVEASKGLGVIALMIQEVSTKRASDHAFSIGSMTSFKSGTGLDLQYHYAKLCSTLKAHPSDTPPSTEDYGSLSKEEHTSLLLTLGQYPEIVLATFRSLEPSNIMAYLHTVLEQLQDCMDEDEDEPEGEGTTNEEKGEEKGTAEITPALAALYESARIVLENGMKLLGVLPVEDSRTYRAGTPIAD
jgi:arginyl-tRNA synthetase